MRRYLNFDLELYGHRLAGGHESFVVRVGRSPAGEQRHAEATAVELPAGLRGQVDRLEVGALEGAERIELGERLGELLLPAGAVRDLFDRSLAALGEEEGLRLRLRIEEPALAALPWELAYLPLPGAPAGQRDQRGFLCLRPELSLTRYEPLPRPPRPFSPVAKPRLVCLSSNPELPGSGRLDLASERERIAAALAPAAIESVYLKTGTFDELRTGLEGGAHLFHFAGHGTFSEGALGEIPRTVEGVGSLLFEDAAGRPLPVAAEKVALSLLGHRIRVVVLNSCYSGRRDAIRAWTGVGPVLAHERLPAVVANQFRVEDRSAIEFARGFYARLAAGAPIDAAVAAGRLAIFDMDPPSGADWASYVLYLRLADTSDGVVFPQGGDSVPSRTFWTNLGLAAAGLVAAVVVFSRQLEPRLDPGWLAFGGLGLLGLAGLVWAFLQFFAGEEIRGTLRRALFSRVATASLAALIATLLSIAWLLPPPSAVLILLPYGNLNRNLPGAALAEGSLCSLEATSEGKVLWTLPRPARQAIVVGATPERLDQLLVGEPLEARLGRILDERQVTDEALRERWLGVWSGERRFEPALSRGKRGPLTLRLIKQGVPEPLWQSRPRRPADLDGTGIKLWVMEAEDESKLETCLPE